MAGGAVYAAVSDITALGKTLSASQESAAGTLLTEASALLRLEANQYGISIDERIADPTTGADYALAVKAVVVAAVCRALDAVADASGLESASETLGPYQYNYKYLNAGRQLYFMKSELLQLGLGLQTVGWADLYGVLTP